MSSESLSTDLEALGQVPDMINQARTMIQTLETIAEVPKAAMSTGSIPASVAISALGVGLVDFFVKTIEALDDDIDAVRDAKRDYEENERNTEESAECIMKGLEQRRIDRRYSRDGETRQRY